MRSIYISILARLNYAWQRLPESLPRLARPPPLDNNSSDAGYTMSSPSHNKSYGERAMKIDSRDHGAKKIQSRRQRRRYENKRSSGNHRCCFTIVRLSDQG